MRYVSNEHFVKKSSIVSCPGTNNFFLFWAMWKSILADFWKSWVQNLRFLLPSSENSKILEKLHSWVEAPNFTWGVWKKRFFVTWNTFCFSAAVIIQLCRSILGALSLLVATLYMIKISKVGGCGGKKYGPIYPPPSFHFFSSFHNSMVFCQNIALGGWKNISWRFCIDWW